MARMDVPAGRDEQIYVDYVEGKRQHQLAREHGLTVTRISQIIAEQRSRIPEQDRVSMVMDSIELQMNVRRRALEVASLDGAPVAVGKDGDIMYDPATGDVVRDYMLRLRALALAAATDDAIAKRLGLDAPKQIESTATVHYKLDGVDVEDLK